MWIVIEAHGGAEVASICVDEDGINLTFETQQEALDYVETECLDGMAIEIQ